MIEQHITTNEPNAQTLPAPSVATLWDSVTLLWNYTVTAEDGDAHTIVISATGVSKEHAVKRALDYIDAKHPTTDMQAELLAGVRHGVEFGEPSIVEDGNVAGFVVIIDPDESEEE